MINKRQRNRIKKVLPFYIVKTKELLKTKGLEYTDDYIRHVFSGVRNNIIIEKAILEAYQRKLQELQDLEAEKEKLFQKK